MKKHTPGPWEVTRYGDGQYSIYPKGEKGYTEEGIDDAEDISNAELIAAAPDLLSERDRLKSVNADLRETLRGLTALCLEMGHTIRSLDESGDHHEEWTNDGEYIPDDRFSAASAVLSNTLDYTNSPTLLNALKSVIEWTDNENNTPPDRLLMLIRNCARAAIQGQSTQDSMALRKGMIAEAASLCEEESSVFLHTPGPWFFDVSTGEVESDFGLIAHVVGYDNPDDETIPNGNLLAAAPALKEKNEELLACVLDVLNADGDLNSMDFNRYRAAVDKAEAGSKPSFPSPGGC